MKRRLIIRLSSLGDVILATSALESLRRRGEPPVDWVVSREYASLLQEHPMIRRVLAFDRSTGLDGWTQLGRELWEARYDEVIDLHDTIRSRMLERWFKGFAQENPGSMRAATGVRWVRFPKERLKFAGLALLRGAWPRGMTSKPYVQRFAEAAGGRGDERPDLSHLLVSAEKPGSSGEVRGRPEFLPESLSAKNYVCVMPSSRWKGKQWAAANYVSVFRHLHWTPVVLGTPKDECSVEVVAGLERAGIEHVSGIGRWTLAETAQVLARSRGILACDTGLAHLAEAVGVPALVILGPTNERVGFAPWRPESKTIGAGLWCRPCSKDGRACFRLTQRHLCLTKVSPTQVIQAARQVFGERVSEAADDDGFGKASKVDSSGES
jgi:ADP-heptose:LPS heptosyltransferase